MPGVASVPLPGSSGAVRYREHGDQPQPSRTLWQLPSADSPAQCRAQKESSANRENRKQSPAVVRSRSCGPSSGSTSNSDGAPARSATGRVMSSWQPELHVVPETVYQALHGRGSLNLAVNPDASLRTGPTDRQPRRRNEHRINRVASNQTPANLLPRRTLQPEEQAGLANLLRPETRRGKSASAGTHSPRLHRINVLWAMLRDHTPCQKPIPRISAQAA